MLVLRISFNNSLNAMNKNLKYSQALTKKGFEFLQGNGNSGATIYILLVLLPL